MLIEKHRIPHAYSSFDPKTLLMVNFIKSTVWRRVLATSGKGDGVKGSVQVSRYKQERMSLLTV